jgi:hypothetical protein
MSDEKLFELLKKKLPDNLAFKTEGGLKGKTEISGSLEDFLDFVERVWKDGYYLDPQDSHINAEGDFVVMPDFDRIADEYDIVVREGGVGLVPKGRINMADVRPPRPTPEKTEKLPFSDPKRWVEWWRNPQEGKVIDVTAHPVDENNDD